MIDNEDFILCIRDIVEELKSINCNLEKLNDTNIYLALNIQSFAYNNRPSKDKS
jgi:hypothetical protein